MAIRYYNQDCTFVLRGKRKTTSWIERVIDAEKAAPGEIAVVFCTDDYLLSVNRKYLQHDYYTDIITFDYSEDGIPRTISGDLMISIDTVQKNAKDPGVTFNDELHRVIIHGILHLLGYGDKSPAEEKKMRALEDHYLAQREEKNEI